MAKHSEHRRAQWREANRKRRADSEYQTRQQQWNKAYERIAMTQRDLIESTAIDIIAAIREHGPTRDVIVPRLEKLAAAFAQDAFYEGFYTGSQNLVSAGFAWASAKSRLQFIGSKK